MNDEYWVFALYDTHCKYIGYRKRMWRFTTSGRAITEEAFRSILQADALKRCGALARPQFQLIARVTTRTEAMQLRKKLVLEENDKGGDVAPGYWKGVTSDAYVPPKETHRGHRVRCIESGEVYSSIEEAARSTKVAAVCIRMVLNKRTKSACGYHWENAEMIQV
jgi:hypothetical protein